MHKHGRRKVPAPDPSAAEAIDAFEHGMGLSIRGFKKTCAFAKKDASLHMDDVRTAFGTECAFPGDFVPPLDNNNDTTKTTPALSTKEPKPVKQRPQSAAPRRCGNQPRPKPVPVDFVYDLDVRKQLRAAIDAERRDLLRATQAREAVLRESSQWLPNSRPDKHAPKHEKVAWSTPRRQRPPPPEKIHAPPAAKVDEVVWDVPAPQPAKKARPKSAVNRRNAVAENVHFASWQTACYHKDDDKPMLSARRQHRRTSQG